MPTTGPAAYSDAVTPTALRRSRRLLAAGAVAVAVLLASAACTGEPETTPAAEGTAPPVLKPGRPGEPNATVQAPSTPAASATASAEDVRFVSDMVVHHAQAIVMADLVDGRLVGTDVAALASRIRAEQGPEIQAMATWLRSRGQEVPPEADDPSLAAHAGHAGMAGMSEMPGMAEPAELDALAAASGKDLDRRFLELMIRHHRGALTMVDGHAGAAADEQVQELSAEISVVQAKQVSQLQGMLDRLS